MTIRKRLERLEAIAPFDADIPTIIINIVTRTPDGEIVSSPTIAKIPTAGDWLELERGDDEAEAAFLARIDEAHRTLGRTQ